MNDKEWFSRYHYSEAQLLQEIDEQLPALNKALAEKDYPLCQEILKIIVDRYYDIELKLKIKKIDPHNSFQSALPNPPKIQAKEDILASFSQDLSSDPAQISSPSLWANINSSVSEIQIGTSEHYQKLLRLQKVFEKRINPQYHPWIAKFIENTIMGLNELEKNQTRIIQNLQKFQQAHAEIKSKMQKIIQQIPEENHDNSHLFYEHFQSINSKKNRN